MSIEKIEKSKAKIDLFIFMFLILWIAVRVLNYLNFEGMVFALHFIRLFLAVGGMFLIMQYLYFSRKMTDEFERENKYKAHKFSWVFTMLSIIVLYILYDKTNLKAEFVIELILWIGYLSYFLAFKFLDAGLDVRFSNKYRKVIGTIALFMASLVIGMNIGYSTPDLSYDQFNQNKVLYIGISILLIVISIIGLLRFIKMVKEHENEKKRN